MSVVTKSTNNCQNILTGAERFTHTLVDMYGTSNDVVTMLEKGSHYQFLTNYSINTPIYRRVCKSRFAEYRGITVQHCKYITFIEDDAEA